MTYYIQAIESDRGYRPRVYHYDVSDDKQINDYLGPEMTLSSQAIDAASDWIDEYRHTDYEIDWSTKELR